MTKMSLFLNKIMQINFVKENEKFQKFFSENFEEKEKKDSFWKRQMKTLV